MEELILAMFLVILMFIVVTALLLSSIVIISPNECGVYYLFNKPTKILVPGMTFKSMANSVKKIRMDESGWESELNQIKNQHPDFSIDVEAFISNAKSIYGTRLRETKDKIIAVTCPKCSSRIEIKLNDYR